MLVEEHNLYPNNNNQALPSLWCNDITMYFFTLMSFHELFFLETLKKVCIE